MLNQVLKVSSGTSQHSVEVLLKSVTFMDFRLLQRTVATYCRWCGNLCEVSNELPGERILKISPHLPKLISNIKWFTFLGTWCIFYESWDKTFSKLNFELWPMCHMGKMSHLDWGTYVIISDLVTYLDNNICIYHF